jgi:uncharacterized membrane protein
MQFRHSALIHAPADRVWTVLRDITRWPEWTPTVDEVQRLDASAIGVGSRFKVHQPKLLPAEWKVTSWAPGTGFEWVSKLPGVATIARHELIPADEGVELALVVEFAGVLGSVAGWMAGGLTKKYLALEADGLKRFCEREEQELA